MLVNGAGFQTETLPRVGAFQDRSVMADQRDPGVPLGQYRQHQAGVRLTCRDCMLHQDWPLELVIERLAVRSVGGERTGVREVARHVRQPCERCGGRRFTAAPAFPNGVAQTR